MPEKVHTKFSDDGAPGGGAEPVLPVVDSQSSHSHKTEPENELRFHQAKKRSANEAFLGHRATGNGPPKFRANGLYSGKRSRVVDFPEDDTISNLVSSKNPAKSPSPGKRGHLQLRAQELLPLRKALPIASHADEIRTKLRSHEVLLLVGETGSGKSTQIPQFLVNEPWCQVRTVSIPTVSEGPTPLINTISANNTKIRVGGCIAVTQPRRLAAISLAARVAAELGSPLGSSSPSSQVGYSVRFDTSVSPSIRIKFLTEGMLLQEMLRDPDLREYSAVVVDEVHERGVNVDLVLGFLRRMVCERGGRAGRGGIGLKVVVMSATADMEGIQSYFSHITTTDEDGHVAGDSLMMKSLNGHTAAPSKEESVESDSDASWSGLSSSPPMPDQPLSATKLRSSFADGSEGNSTKSLATSCHIKGRQYPVRIIYTPSPVQDILDSALHRIIHIHTHEPLPGDILVFLTGQEAVETLASLCQEAYLSLTQNPKTRSTVPKLLILPLFAALPQHAQQRVFDRTPSRTRKVILSTNIAETSLTVPGIRYVVDSGKCKKKQFRSRLGLDSLLVKPISKSAANQRKGRAGREAPGTCYRLYTEKDYLLLDQDNDPEILRCDLSQTVLSLKARHITDILAFRLLTPIPLDPLSKSLLHLLQLHALHPQTGHITPLGTLLAKLPLSPPLARVLLASHSPRHNCLPQAIDLISALSVENIFLTPNTEEQREEASSARRTLFRRQGDHLTLLAAVQAYVAEPSNRRAWCDSRFISHRAMQAVMDVRKQLLALSRSLLPDGDPPANPPDTDNDPLADRLLKALLTGFPTHTARLMPDGSYRTLQGNQTVAIHPSSVLFGAGRKCEAIVYSEFVFTQKSYARRVSEVAVGWVGEVLAEEGV